MKFTTKSTKTQMILIIDLSCVYLWFKEKESKKSYKL